MLFGLILRLALLGNRDLGLDEAVSYFFCKDNTLKDLISPFSPVITSDVHPPLYYVFTHIWLKSGYPILLWLTENREFSIRIPFVFISVLTLLILYENGRRIRDGNFALILTLLYAVNSFSIQIVHNTRMYPIVEFLSASLMLFWIRLRMKNDIWNAICLASISSLLFLTHYATIFYIATVWMMYFWKNRSDLKKIMIPSTVLVLSTCWWLPGFLGQFGKEASSQFFSGSSGAIIPFSLFQFLTGERSLFLGRFPTISQSVSVFVFILCAFCILLRFRIIQNKETITRELIVICLMPLFLQWLATFVVYRVFHASYYAIFAVPVFLIIFAMFSVRYSNERFLKSAIFLIIYLAINIYTVSLFYMNRLTPYEPWRKAAYIINESKSNAYIYPSYMKAMINFYAPDTHVTGLDSNCQSAKTDWPSKKIDDGNSDEIKNIYLIISHDRGLGECYRQFFRKSFYEPTKIFRLHNIYMERYMIPSGT